MRILHTSDWHLGRSFHRVGMLDAQAAYVDHLVEVVRTEAVDVVLVAGDVYDRALPGVDVVALLDDALVRLVAAGAVVVLSSGNHDSGRRLGFASRLLESARVHVRTDPARAGDPVLLDDRYGSVALYPLPYLEPSVVAPGLGTDPTHAAVVAAATGLARADLSGRPGTRSVVAAHAFVVGGTASDSERDIAVGGVPSVPQSALDGFDYAALGHLHGRQRLADHVRYSGSPLAYSFSEHRHTKGGWLVELGPGGVERVDPVDAPVPRPLALLRGDLEALLLDPAHRAAEAAWCQVTLTDPARPREAMQRLRARFPHTLELRFEPRTEPGTVPMSYTARVAGRDDLDVCCGFVEHVRSRAVDDDEVALLREALDAGRVAEMEASGVAPLRGRRRPGRPVLPAAPARADDGHGAAGRGLPARDVG